jgi:hypothetical protein
MDPLSIANIIFHCLIIFSAFTAVGMTLLAHRRFGKRKFGDPHNGTIVVGLLQGLTFLFLVVIGAGNALSSTTRIECGEIVTSPENIQAFYTCIMYYFGIQALSLLITFK